MQTIANRHAAMVSRTNMKIVKDGVGCMKLKQSARIFRMSHVDEFWKKIAEGMLCLSCPLYYCGADEGSMDCAQALKQAHAEAVAKDYGTCVWTMIDKRECTIRPGCIPTTGFLMITAGPKMIKEIKTCLVCGKKIDERIKINNMIKMVR